MKNVIIFKHLILTRCLQLEDVNFITNGMMEL